MYLNVEDLIYHGDVDDVLTIRLPQYRDKLPVVSDTVQAHSGVQWKGFDIQSRLLNWKFQLKYMYFWGTNGTALLLLTAELD